jgi:hypothetical protein
VAAVGAAEVVTGVSSDGSNCPAFDPNLRSTATR